MEELTLQDLVFDNDNTNNEMFDEFKAGLEDNQDDTDLEKKEPKGEDQKVDPESVAKEKDKQVQGGKTSDKSKEEGGDNSSSPKPNDTEQLYSKLATQFKTSGVLPGLENTEEIKSLEDLNSAIEKEVNSRLTATQLRIKEASELGLDASEVSKQVSVIEKLKSVNDSYIEDDQNIEFRRGVIAQDFISKGYSKDRAIVFAQRSIDAGTDVEDAKLALKSIIGYEEQKIADAIKAAKEDEAKSINDIKSHLEKTEEVIPGVKLSASQKDELYRQMTTDLGGKENAFMKAQKQDPVGSRIKLEALFFITKGFKDFSVFGASKESDITKNIENLLRGTDFTDSGRVNTDIKDSESNFSLADLKDLEIE